MLTFMYSHGADAILKMRVGWGGVGFIHREVVQSQHLKLDDGWPESAEEHVALVLLKRLVVS